jgi:hypothetical protein
VGLLISFGSYRDSSFNSLAVQCVPSRYTDYVIPAATESQMPQNDSKPRKSDELMNIIATERSTEMVKIHETFTMLEYLSLCYPLVVGNGNIL